MKSVNKVMLLGNATRDAETCEHDGVPACTFGLATRRSYRDAEGDRCTLAEFSYVIVVGHLVSACLLLVKKGKPIYLEGYLKTEDGTTWIIANEVVFLGSEASVNE